MIGFFCVDVLNLNLMFAPVVHLMSGRKGWKQTTCNLPPVSFLGAHRRLFLLELCILDRYEIDLVDLECVDLHVLRSFIHRYNS